jgi:hypothetical protein
MDVSAAGRERHEQRQVPFDQVAAFIGEPVEIVQVFRLAFLTGLKIQVVLGESPGELRYQIIIGFFLVEQLIDGPLVTERKLFFVRRRGSGVESPRALTITGKRD